MAGTGKSTISRTLARSSFHRSQLGASFFFKRGKGDQGSMSKFFTTIAAQLIRRELVLAVHVKEAIDTDPAICYKAMREQFEKLILELLSHVQNTNTLVIVVDALDECDRDEDVKRLIYLLSRANAFNPPCLRIFLTSRPELPIRLAFMRLSNPLSSMIYLSTLHTSSQRLETSIINLYYIDTDSCYQLGQRSRKYKRL
ncbi:hypothetical protein F5X98DRAFT_385143 [Xylaria grammica]|nr:hypothetical protein F5X98DRAFT_385143 [Xylaria grammica]